MFGALNRFISRLDSETPAGSSAGPHPPFGFQILRNKNAEISLEPWFDFIVGINGRQIVSCFCHMGTLLTSQDNPDPFLFATEIRNCAGSDVSLTYFCAKGQQILTLSIPVPTPSPTLGLTLQWTSLALADQVWHILSVQPNSPADLAGLLPYGDYIVGTPEGQIHGEAGLGELVEEYVSRELRLWIYNHEFDITRLVTITPSKSWGGEGALGCVLGFGALHRLPAPLTEGPVAGPGEALFEGQPSTLGNAAYSTNPEQLLVPANMQTPPNINANDLAVRAPKRGRRPISPSGGFDEMFQEGAERSSKEDAAPDRKVDAADLPPAPSMPADIRNSPSGSVTDAS